MKKLFCSLILLAASSAALPHDDHDARFEMGAAANALKVTAEA